VQTWSQLLFAHWPVDASLLRASIPAPLELQEREGAAWIGVVPFWLGVRPRYVPPLPRVSSFPELNVRTYVECEGKPGVWFLSLDARNPLAVRAARRFFHLPYYRARMSALSTADETRYRSERLSGSEKLPRFEASYGPSAPVRQARSGSLEHWLTERYCLYAARSDGAVFRAEVHHAPWPLQDGWADIAANSMLEPAGIELVRAPALLHYAEHLDVVVWGLEKVSG
jgi:uncharacterized protein YqjF (DUF2071 family)